MEQQFLFLDRVMYARNQQYKYNKEPVTGGQPITVEQAKVSDVKKLNINTFFLT